MESIGEASVKKRVYFSSSTVSVDPFIKVSSQGIVAILIGKLRIHLFNITLSFETDGIEL